MVTAYLIDDMPANINTMRHLLEDYCHQVTVIGHAGNITDGYKGICTLHPDIVFLDIEMPDGNGFDLLKRFKSATFETIFVTAYNKYAVGAFRERALDYLLKPIDIDALQNAVTKAEEHIKLKRTQNQLASYMMQIPGQTTGQPSRISLPVQDGYMFVDVENIIRIEASGSYSWVHLAGPKKLLISMRLKECEGLLPARYFCRVHNSHMVNVRYVSRYIRGRGGYVIMQDETEVEVSESKKAAFLDMMNNRQ